jgi:hypothetical protein
MMALVTDMTVHLAIAKPVPKEENLHFDLIDVTPAPILARFDRLHNGMFGPVKMFGRMFVLRRIAASHMAALQAHSQVNPSVTHLQAFFAPGSARANILYHV